MEEKRPTVTTVKRGNTIETVIEGNSPQLMELCDKLRAAKMQKQKELRDRKCCAINITL